MSVGAPLGLLDLSALVPETEARLRALGAAPGEVPADLARAEARGIRLVASRWVSDRFDARLVSIRGSKTSVANAMIFPQAGAALPVYASELLSFGPRALGFVDLQTPGLTGAALGLAQQAARRASSASGPFPDSLPPEWALADSSGSFVFARGELEGLGALLASAHRRYLVGWEDLLASFHAASQEQPAALRNYKEHHRAATPGNRFLGSLYGAAWARRFFSAFLYA